MTCTIGFIMIRNVTDSNSNELWIHCYHCIRKFYPLYPIIIIDDNSNYDFISTIHLTNTTIIDSSFKNKGLFLAYYYYLQYKFFDKTDKNVYWVKIYLLRDWLITGKYDYVMWMDTDAMFVNYNIDLKYVLGLFNSDIFLSHDNDYPLTARKTLNAGVFIIKNSEIGINFLNEAINIFEKSKCQNSQWSID